MKFVLTPTEKVPLMWPRAEELIEQSLAYSNEETNGSFLKRKVFDGRFHLWSLVENDDSKYTIRGIAVTGVQQYETGRRVIDIVAVAASCPREDWLCRLKDLEEYARLMGADAIEFTGRMGWYKLMKQEGFGNAEVKMTKELK